MGIHQMAQNQMTTVGSRIVEARKAKEMTQLDLAKLLGISRAAVGQWEIDATSPSIAKLEEVAMILGVEPQWLAYNVKPGEVRVVYRNPERDNIIWVNELKFGDAPDDLPVGDKWGIPSEYLTRELNTPSRQRCSVHGEQPCRGARVRVRGQGHHRPERREAFAGWNVPVLGRHRICLCTNAGDPGGDRKGSHLAEGC